MTLMLPATNPIRRAVAAVLAASLVFCCCHAHFLVGGVADAASLSAAAGGSSACCAGCAGDADRADPVENRPDAPSDGCQICCVKGTGQKDGGPVLLDAGAVTPMAASPAALLPLPARCPDARPERLAARCRVEPPTLLRLRCALLV